MIHKGGYMNKIVLIMMLCLIATFVYGNNQDIFDNAPVEVINIPAKKIFNYETGQLIAIAEEEVKLSVGNASKSYTVPVGKVFKFKIVLQGRLEDE